MSIVSGVKIDDIINLQRSGGCTNGAYSEQSFNVEKNSIILKAILEMDVVFDADNEMIRVSMSEISDPTNPSTPISAGVFLYDQVYTDIVEGGSATTYHTRLEYDLSWRKVNSDKVFFKVYNGTNTTFGYAMTLAFVKQKKK